MPLFCMSSKIYINELEFVKYILFLLKFLSLSLFCGLGMENFPGRPTRKIFMA